MFFEFDVLTCLRIQKSFDKAEIDQKEFILLGFSADQYILWLDISMDYIPLLHVD